MWRPNIPQCFLHGLRSRSVATIAARRSADSEGRRPVGTIEAHVLSIECRDHTRLGARESSSCWGRWLHVCAQGGAGPAKYLFGFVGNPVLGRTRQPRVELLTGHSWSPRRWWVLPRGASFNVGYQSFPCHFLCSHVTPTLSPRCPATSIVGGRLFGRAGGTMLAQVAFFELWRDLPTSPSSSRMWDSSSVCETSVDGVLECFNLILCRERFFQPAWGQSNRAPAARPCDAMSPGRRVVFSDVARAVPMRYELP